VGAGVGVGVTGADVEAGIGTRVGDVVVGVVVLGLGRDGIRVPACSRLDPMCGPREDCPQSSNRPTHRERRLDREGHSRREWSVPDTNLSSHKARCEREGQGLGKYYDRQFIRKNRLL
jgi:hypothetical protein